jgi:sec-independent protein translocase protein TatB
MELSIGEMALIAIAIVVLFGPDKLPQIARDLGSGVRKMRGSGRHQNRDHERNR